MSLTIRVAELLRKAHQAFPPAHGCRHSLSLHEGRLCLTISLPGIVWQRAYLDDQDLDRDPDELVAEIKAYLAGGIREA